MFAQGMTLAISRPCRARFLEVLRDRSAVGNADAQGPYSNMFQLNGLDYMNRYLNSFAPLLDIMIQGGSSVTMIKGTYFY